jgi:hypothetical protein
VMLTAACAAATGCREPISLSARESIPLLVFQAGTCGGRTACNLPSDQRAMCHVRLQAVPSCNAGDHS